MKSKTKTNPTLCAWFFPRFEQVAGTVIAVNLIGSWGCFIQLSLVGIITLVLVFRQSFERHWSNGLSYTYRPHQTVRHFVAKINKISIKDTAYQSCYSCGLLLVLNMKKKRGGKKFNWTTYIIRGRFCFERNSVTPPVAKTNLIPNFWLTFTTTSIFAKG